MAPDRRAIEDPELRNVPAHLFQGGSPARDLGVAEQLIVVTHHDVVGVSGRRGAGSSRG